MTTVNPTPARGRGRPAGGRDVPLCREDIVERALEMVRTEGQDALSMRGLARELGVSPMALYYHVADKRALLAALVERVWNEIISRTPQGFDDPIETLVASSTVMRRVWLENFDLARLAVTVFEADDVLFATTVSLTQAFEMAGFPDVPLAYNAIQNFTMGCVEITANRRAASAFFGREPADVLHKARRLFVRRGASPTQMGVLEARFDEGDERHFEEALRALIAGLLAGSSPDPS